MLQNCVYTLNISHAIFVFRVITKGNENMKENRTALRISLLAVTTALVAVFTMLVRVPTPTGGYINLCDVAITFIAYTFGPITGFIAGGLGTALADALGGYMQYAPISFVVHGLEALLVALIVRKDNTTLLTKILAGVVAVVVVAGGYWLLAGTFLIGLGTAVAEIPGNMLQAGVGAVFGLIVSEAVRKAYRKVDTLRW